MMGLDSEPLLLNESDPELGGKDTRETITNDFAYRNNVANAAIRIRLAFIRKVYCLLAFQLALTIILSSVALFVPTVQFYIAHNDWLVLLAFVGTFGFLIALFAYRKKHPHNLILLTGFTITESYTIGVIISRFDTVTVLQAVSLTFIVVLGLTFYTFQTKRDFTTIGAGLSAGLCVLIFGGILQLFVGGSGLEFLVSCGGAFLFSLFIIYDTQLLMQKLSPEEYILATISLYMDIINLFLYILRILAEAKRQ